MHMAIQLVHQPSKRTFGGTVQEQSSIVMHTATQLAHRPNKRTFGGTVQEQPSIVMHTATQLVHQANKKTFGVIVQGQPNIVMHTVTQSAHQPSKKTFGVIARGQPSKKAIILIFPFGLGSAIVTILIISRGNTSAFLCRCPTFSGASPYSYNEAIIIAQI